MYIYALERRFRERLFTYLSRLSSTSGPSRLADSEQPAFVADFVYSNYFHHVKFLVICVEVWKSETEPGTYLGVWLTYDLFHILSLSITIYVFVVIAEI
jgi:hypothetical protein